MDSVMQANLYGTLRLITGKKTVLVELPSGATVRELLEEIIRQFPAMQPELMEDDSSLRKDLPLFVNGRNPRLLPDSIESPLQPGDIVSLFSPVSSGRMSVGALRQHASGKKE
jgi:molybdopterin synthase sulfur carrier subunit